MALKDQANTQFQARNFQEAIKLYSKAISVCPALVVLRLNRAAAYLMLVRPATTHCPVCRLTFTPPENIPCSRILWIPRKVLNP
jgi:predicted Zn-dependent protease